MKKISILSLLIALFLCSCGKEYLVTVPTGSTSAATIFETTEGAAMAVNGLNKLMNRQWISSQGYNGEGTIRLYFGDYPGETMYVANLTGWVNTINGEYHANNNDTRDNYAWHYYYMLIGNANSILANIDACTGLETEKEYIKAQALCYRAYAYMNLIQLYAVRWCDSADGAADGVVLRIDTSTDPLPLSTQAQVYKQIYDDLDEAITLFKSSGINRSAAWEMGLDVAYAIYARTAITKQDYAKALEMAGLARASYPLMSVADYKKGFCKPTSEWIWYLYGTETETLYYYSYFAYVAYNAAASQVRSYPKCINREYFEKIPATDIRKSLFLDPTGYTYTTSTGKASAALQTYAHTYCTTNFGADFASNGTAFAYMQFKVQTDGQPGIGHLNLFRSSEMLLIEAEAEYFLNHPTNAQNLLVELNKTSGRDPSYACSKTGEDLLKEIKFYRAIELWGEGFNWFDLKRWKDPLTRHAHADGGNYIASMAVSYPATGDGSRNEWTWVIPRRETDYNPLIKK